MEDIDEENNSEFKDSTEAGQFTERLVEMIQGMPSASDVNFEKEMGADEAIQEPDVDISLYPSRDISVAGELWSISGAISNRSTNPIWIVNGATTLSLAPEMYGQSSQTGSMGAFFPTVKSRHFAEVVRIDPGASYSVVWKIDPLSSKEESGAKQAVYKRVLNSISSFLFFNPGKFKVSSITHIWSTKPEFSDKGQVENYGCSFVKSVTSDIEMESSPWVLITGAAVGGILCFILQLLFGAINLGDSFLSIIKGLSVGFTSAVILGGVVTVLLSRLATTDFILVVKIKDIWGAIATGFIIQWFGFPIIEKILS